MPDPDVEKKRKRRKRSARVYLSNAHPLPSPEQLAALVDQFPSDEDDDDKSVAKPSVGKRKFSQSRRRELARRGMALSDGSYPIENSEDLDNAVVLARTGHGDAEAAKKLIARRARELGVKNPLEGSEKAMRNYPDPFGPAEHAAARVSAPYTRGHPAPAVDDHGVGEGRSSFLAAHHPDLRQSNTSFDAVLARLRTVAGDNAYGDRDITYTAGEVGLRMFDARGQAGHYHDMQAVNPSPQRPDFGIARNGAVPPNGSHSLSQPEGRHPMSMKASDRREIMRRHMFGGGNGAR